MSMLPLEMRESLLREDTHRAYCEPSEDELNHAFDDECWGPVHEWRNYVPATLRAEWRDLPPITRFIVWWFCEGRAGAEEWE